MAHLQYLDDLVREYLLFRGFIGTVKVFDSELKSDKDKGFRVDKLIEQLTQHIYSYDLTALRELWAHLDHKFFSRLEQDFTPGIRKLENAVLKMYVVNAVVNGKHDRLNEFFTRLSPELQGQAEWKDWFVIPFIKNPEENPNFSVHFTRHWQDTLFVSLHNFLSTVFQVMPLPTLASLDQDVSRLRRLQEENDTLRARLASLMDNPQSSTGSQSNSQTGSTLVNIQDIQPPEVPHQPELMDDFYIIAQGNIPGPPSNDSQAKTLKSLIRNIGGLPGSPIMGRKPSTQGPQTGLVAQSAQFAPMLTHAGGSKTKTVQAGVPPDVSHKRSSSKPRVSHSRPTPPVSESANPARPAVSALPRQAPSSTSTSATRTPQCLPTTPPSGAFLLLGQESMSEHRSAVTHCRFNTAGTTVVSADVDGVIKVWDAGPALKMVSTFVTKSRVLAVDWVPVTKDERFLMAVCSNGVARLLDSQSSRPCWELGSDNSAALKGLRLLNLVCSPTEGSFLCSAVSPQGAGKLMIFDMKTRQSKQTLSLSGSSQHATTFSFNHNGQLAVCGCSDGSVEVFDLRRGTSIESWTAHSGPVLTMRLTPDYTACFTAGTDNKIYGRSLNQSGQALCEGTLPDLAKTFVHQTQKLQPTQLFAFDQSGSHILARGSSQSTVHQVSGLERVFELPSGRNPVLAVDWTSANQCSTCLSGLSNGMVSVSTLLTT